jgi:hypothetical protein
VVIAAVMVLLQSCVPAWPQTVRTRTASRAIVQSGLSVHESWRKGNLVVRDAGGVLASENYVIFVDTSMGFNMGRLQVLDAATGQSQWQVTDLSQCKRITSDFRMGTRQPDGRMV